MGRKGCQSQRGCRTPREHGPVNQLNMVHMGSQRMKKEVELKRVHNCEMLMGITSEQMWDEVQNPDKAVDGKENCSLDQRLELTTEIWALSELCRGSAPLLMVI